MQQPYNLILEAFTLKKKNTIILEIKNAISESDSWIINHNTLSDKLIQFEIETDAGKIEKLLNSLKTTSIQFYDFSLQQYENLLDNKPKNDLYISLNINFSSSIIGDLGSIVD